MKVPFPRRSKAWLAAAVSLIVVTVVGVAPMMRSRAQAPPSYTITDLGALGGTESKAFGINSCGQIAGYATNGSGSKRPFFRPSNSLIDLLGALSGSGIATNLNNSGYVVGHSPADGSADRAFIWHDDNGNNISDGVEMKQLLPIGETGHAEDINNNGTVVGWTCCDETTLGFEGFIWENNTFQTVAPGVSLQPFGINDAGAIVGTISSPVRGFILRNGALTQVSSNRSAARAVSEANPVHVVGTASVGSIDVPTHAFIWTDAAGIKDLGTLSGLTNSDAYGIAIVNGLLQVVGTSYNNASDMQAFVWQDDGDENPEAGEMKDLLSLVSNNTGPDWTRLSEARSINTSGQIVGFGTKNGQTHAFLLTPASGGPSQCLPTVTVSVSPSSVNEDAGGPMTYTFTRSIVTASQLTVSFSTTGTAAANDYGISAVSNVQIPANAASVAVTVTPIADTTDEPDETVILTVTPDTLNYNVGAPNAATGTISDNDATPTIQITSVTAAEPTSGSTSFAFTVSLTNPSSSQITVNYATDTTGASTPASGGAGPGCGAAGVDFVNASGGLTFAAGETSKQVNVTVCGDSDVEPDETFFVNLSGNTNSNLPLNTKGTGTITPQAPTIFTEAAGPTCPAGDCAIAIDSVTFVRAPFKLTNDWNLTPSDRATRIILFTSNLGMTQANLASGVLSVHIDGSAIPLANIENVGTVTGVAGLSASYIIVKLPATLSNPSPGPTNKTLVVKMGSATSNATTFSITP